MGGLMGRLATLALLAIAFVLMAAGCGDDDDGFAGENGGRVTVTTTADNNERDGEISLREAILIVTNQIPLSTLDEDELDKVDGEPGRPSDDTVEFDLDDDAVIALQEALPSLNGGGDELNAVGEDVMIDGSAADFVCLDLASSRNKVFGLWLEGCRTGIDIPQGYTRNRIGGPGNGEGNVIVDGVVGIRIAGVENVVQGNHIGVEPGGTEARGNEFEGVWLTLQARDNLIGGPGEGEGNVISGNPLYGISINGAEGNVIQGNYLGLDTSGRVAVGNRTAINLQNGAFGNLIGGAEAGERNVIAGNTTGVLLTGDRTATNTVRGNLFGTSVGEGESLPNSQNIYFGDRVGENEIFDNEMN